MTSGSDRRWADAAVGAAAAAALVALVVGVPAVLIALSGLPVPHAWPAPSLLTRRLDGAAVLKICALVVWLAWLQLVWCVAAEVAAVLRNAGMPRRVPLAGPVQPLVHRLVTSALLLSAVAALSSGLVTPALAGQAPPAAGASPTRVVAGGAGWAGATGAARPGPVGGPDSAGTARSAGTADTTGPPGGADAIGSPESAGAAGPGKSAAALSQEASRQAAGPGRRTEKIYVVQPPVGRFHESLWEIAQRHLGDGRRYREIFELNEDRPQPDGSTLTIASLIRPGWVLRMPPDAHGPGIEVVGARAADSAPHAYVPHAYVPHAHVPHAQAPSSPPAASRPPGARRATSAAAPAAGPPVYPLELAGAGLLAAAVLIALERRRREQLRNRTPGRRLNGPEPGPALVEAALRDGAREPAARLLDAGLRQLGQALAEQGRMPPVVLAAHLGEDAADLWVSPPDQRAPAPWSAVGDGQVWRLPFGAAPAPGPGPGPGPGRPDPAPAPYPGLVSIGADRAGQVLLDLGSAPGVIAVAGPDRLARAALAAIAAELATSMLADRLSLTLVGFGSDLAVLAPDRVRIARQLAEVLPSLEAAPPAGGSARQPPRIVLTAVTPSDAERDRMLALAGTGRSAICLVAGEVPGATRTWEVTPDGRLRTDLGLDVQANLLLPQQRAAVVDLFHAAGQRDGVELGLPPAADSVLYADPPDDARAPVEVALLGPASVRAPGVIEPGRLALATEIVVYLAVHPGGVHPNVLAGAIWPRGVTAEVLDSAVGRVGDWLGVDGIGRPHMATDAGGRLRLGSQVRVDWQVFQGLLRRAWGPDEGACLTEALRLVSGGFLDERPPGRYGWLAADSLEFEVAARVADAAHRLAELRMDACDPHGAIEALRAGLRLARHDEVLWRDLLSAAHATGEEPLLRAVVGEVRAKAARDDVRSRLAPQTEALIEDLLPSWRTADG